MLVRYDQLREEHALFLLLISAFNPLLVYEEIKKMINLDLMVS